LTLARIRLHNLTFKWVSNKLTYYVEQIICQYVFNSKMWNNSPQLQISEACSGVKSTLSVWISVEEMVGLPVRNNLKVIENQYIHVKKLILMAKIRGEPGHFDNLGFILTSYTKKLRIFYTQEKSDWTFYTCAMIIRNGLKNKNAPQPTVHFVDISICIHPDFFTSILYRLWNCLFQLKAG